MKRVRYGGRVNMFILKIKGFLTLGCAAVDAKHERLLTEVPLVWRTTKICHSHVGKKSVS